MPRRSKRALTVRRTNAEQPCGCNRRPANDPVRMKLKPRSFSDSSEIGLGVNTWSAAPQLGAPGLPPPFQRENADLVISFPTWLTPSAHTCGSHLGSHLRLTPAAQVRLIISSTFPTCGSHLATWAPAPRNRPLRQTRRAREAQGGRELRGAKLLEARRTRRVVGGKEKKPR